MINPQTGAPHTAHTTNAVPFIMTGDPKKLKFLEDKKPADGEETEEGALCDVAPTILDILGLPQPEGSCSYCPVLARTDVLTSCRNVRTFPPREERVNRMHCVN